MGFRDNGVAKANNRSRKTRTDIVYSASKRIGKWQWVWKSYESRDNLEAKEGEKGKLRWNSPFENAGGYTTLGKSVLFWAQRKFGYEYGTGFRGKNLTNLDINMFKANADFGTKEEKSWGS